MSVQEALAQIPYGLRPGLESAYQNGGDMVNALMQRGDMEPARALMAGLAMNPVGRDLFEEALDDYARVNEALPNEWPEVIVGGGAHAAIWAATKAALGAPRPLVLEKRARFGGTFALTSRASFFLNSRNRPGPIGGAGSRDALNVIIGAPMQPSDLSGSEYQSNADLGLVVRCTLALNAEVRKAKVQAIRQNGDRLVVITDRGLVRARRVVMATGVGRPLKFKGTIPDNERLFTFNKFMRRFDRSMFPLRNLGRVAVVGAGDSARTVVESLAGYGPYVGGSVASLDYVPRIDWYGVGAEMTKERWLECNRTRYKRLAALFPSQDGKVQNARVIGQQRLSSIFRAADGVQINGQGYDTVIVCIGLSTVVNDGVAIDENIGYQGFRSGNEASAPDVGALLGRVSTDRSFVIVGPAAALPFEDKVEPKPQIPENNVALFRLAPRTATLARMLPTP